MAGIAAVFEAVQTVFTTIDHILTPVPAILTAITNVFDPIPCDGAPASRFLREQRSRANEGQHEGGG
ncbi:MAG: hypothetical protein M3O61_19200 [Gemmatimonadota bacterium]|nr:hypothetical protein [Gemmatimonadota bacterium]